MNMLEQLQSDLARIQGSQSPRQQINREVVKYAMRRQIDVRLAYGHLYRAYGLFDQAAWGEQNAAIRPIEYLDQTGQLQEFLTFIEEEEFYE